MSLTAEHRPVLSTVANTTRRTDGNDRTDALTMRTLLRAAERAPGWACRSLLRGRVPHGRCMPGNGLEEASCGPVTPNHPGLAQRHAGLDITLSDGEVGGENAHRAADMAAHLVASAAAHPAPERAFCNTSDGIGLGVITWPSRCCDAWRKER